MAKNKVEWIYDYGIFYSNQYGVRKLYVKEELEDRFIVVNNNGGIEPLFKNTISRTNESTSSCAYFCIGERNDELAKEKIISDLEEVRARRLKKAMEELSRINEEIDKDIDTITVCNELVAKL